MDQVRLVTRVADARVAAPAAEERAVAAPLDREALIEVLDQQMREAAAELDFELAAQLRDQVFELRAAGDPVRKRPRAGRTTGRVGRA